MSSAMIVGLTLGLLLGFFVGGLIGRGVSYKRRLREAKRHIKQVEGYYREYRTASYKNAVRLEIVRDVVRGVAERAISSNSPYRDAVRPEWMNTVNNICDGHGYRVSGPYATPLDASIDDEEPEGGLTTTVFPMGQDYWAVTELESK